MRLAASGACLPTQISLQISSVACCTCYSAYLVCMKSDANLLPEPNNPVTAVGYGHNPWLALSLFQDRCIPTPILLIFYASGTYKICKGTASAHYTVQDHPLLSGTLKPKRTLLTRAGNLGWNGSKDALLGKPVLSSTDHRLRARERGTCSDTRKSKLLSDVPAAPGANVDILRNSSKVRPR